MTLKIWNWKYSIIFLWKTNIEVLKMNVFGRVEEKMSKIEKMQKWQNWENSDILKKNGYCLEFIKCEYNCIILYYIILYYIILEVQCKNKEKRDNKEQI